MIAMAPPPPPCCVLSFAARGTITPQAMLLDNALSFTLQSTPIIVHVSDETNQSIADAGIAVQQLTHPNAKHRALFQSLIPRLSRVAFNRARLVVAKHSPGILAAHLSNFQMCLQMDTMPCGGHAGGDVKFVLLSANQYLLRRGLENWVAAHSMSFCRGDVCTDVAHGGAVWGSDAALHGLESANADLVTMAQASPLRQVSGGQAFIASTSSWSPPPEDARGWFAPFVKLLAQSRGGRLDAPPSAHHLRTWRDAVLKRTLNDTLWPCSTVADGACSRRPARGSSREAQYPPAWNHHPHEGSFYPVRLLRAFVAALNTSVYFEAMIRQQAPGCTRRQPSCWCPCCPLYGKRYTLVGGGGACAFEEFLLPTYALQAWSHLLPQAAPPIVLRVWANLGRLRQRNGTAAFKALASLVRDGGQQQQQQQGEEPQQPPQPPQPPQPRQQPPQQPQQQQRPRRQRRSTHLVEGCRATRCGPVAAAVARQFFALKVPRHMLKELAAML